MCDYHVILNHCHGMVLIFLSNMEYLKTPKLVRGKIDHCTCGTQGLASFWPTSPFHAISILIILIFQGFQRGVVWRFLISKYLRASKKHSFVTPGLWPLFSQRLSSRRARGACSFRFSLPPSPVRLLAEEARKDTSWCKPCKKVIWLQMLDLKEEKTLTRIPNKLYETTI